MGNSVGIVNNSNVILNTALCVVIRYYEANKLLPGHAGQWDGVGYVWFSVVMVPWYGPNSEFGDCTLTYHDYVDRIPHLAKNVSESGFAELGYLKITGRNVTVIQAEERLRNLAYWGDGFKPAGHTLTWSGGPPARAVTRDPHTIDISEHFENIALYMRENRKIPAARPEDNEIDVSNSWKEGKGLVTRKRDAVQTG